MAEVLLAHREGLKKRVVLKHVLEMHADDPGFVGMLRREASVAATLDHPNVVQVHDFLEEEGKPYLVMEFLDGRNLREMLKRCADTGRRLPTPVGCRVIADVLAGLAYAHARTDGEGHALGLVHRDVTPSNVVVTWSGAVKLIDFGIAKAMHAHGAELTRVGQFKGKCAYMSPEQMCGRPLDHRSDVFSAGVVLWETLTNRRLFARKSDLDTMRAVCDEPIPAPSQFAPELPPALDVICARALARNPAERYRDAGAMRADLEAVILAMRWSASSLDVERELNTLFDGCDTDPSPQVGVHTGPTQIIQDRRPAPPSPLEIAAAHAAEMAAEPLYGDWPSEEIYVGADPQPAPPSGLRFGRLIIAAAACFVIGAAGTAALSMLLQ
jgi:serine/threonine protein kinase